jgi:hypothetical protein
MQATRQFGEGSERLLPLALSLLGFLLGVLLGLPIKPPLLAFFRRALLLGSVLDPPLRGLLIAPCLLGRLDDSLNHPLERGLIDAVLLGVTLALDVVQPLNRRQLT